MNEERMREIAREEIARYAEDVAAVERARKERYYVVLPEHPCQPNDGFVPSSAVADDLRALARSTKKTLQGES